jgi:hypothetical protein
MIRNSFVAQRTNANLLLDCAYAHKLARLQILNLFNMSHILKVPYGQSCRLLVQDNTQERSIDVKSTVVLDESELSEFVHEETDPRARCANHFRQHLLRYFGKHLWWLGFLAITSEQQESPSQASLDGIEKLIDQVFLEPDVPGKNVRHEAVGEGMFRVEHPHHVFFSNE